MASTKQWASALFCLAFCIQASAFDMYDLGEAQTIKVGGHAAYYGGGDVDDEGITGGGQIIFQATRHFSLELSLVEIREDADQTASAIGIDVEGELEVDIAALALTARADVPLTTRFALYAGGGIGYYFIDVDEDVTVSPAEPFTGIGAPTDIDTDAGEEFGFHVTAGAAFLIFDNIELFADYRFTFLDADIDSDATISSVEGEALAGLSNDVDGLDFGLIRIGVNMWF